MLLGRSLAVQRPKARRQALREAMKEVRLECGDAQRRYRLHPHTPDLSRHLLVAASEVRSKQLLQELHLTERSDRGEVQNAKALGETFMGSLYGRLEIEHGEG